MSPAKAFALAALCAALAFQPAMAQERSYDIMVEEGGRPLKKNKGVQPNGEPKKRAQPKASPRGSSYIPPTAIAAHRGDHRAAVHRASTMPPPVNSFSDRVINCNHSFPLNAGIGNNPTDRSSYVRQCANSETAGSTASWR